MQREWGRLEVVEKISEIAEMTGSGGKIEKPRQRKY